MTTRGPASTEAHRTLRAAVRRCGFAGRALLRALVADADRGARIVDAIRVLLLPHERVWFDVVLHEMGAALAVLRTIPGALDPDPASREN